MCGFCLSAASRPGRVRFTTHARSDTQDCRQSLLPYMTSARHGASARSAQFLGWQFCAFLVALRAGGPVARFVAWPARAPSPVGRSILPLSAMSMRCAAAAVLPGIVRLSLRCCCLALRCCCLAPRCKAPRSRSNRASALAGCRLTEVHPFLLWFSAKLNKRSRRPAFQRFCALLRWFVPCVLEEPRRQFCAQWPVQAAR